MYIYIYIYDCQSDAGLACQFWDLQEKALVGFRVQIHRVPRLCCIASLWSLGGKWIHGLVTMERIGHKLEGNPSVLGQKYHINDI